MQAYLMLVKFIIVGIVKLSERRPQENYNITDKSENSLPYAKLQLTARKLKCISCIGFLKTGPWESFALKDNFTEIFEPLLTRHCFQNDPNHDQNS